MPSYRYLKDIKPEDLEPEKEAELTPKQKRANWWHYNWKWVAIGVVAVIIIAAIIAEQMKVVAPDVTIGILTKESLPEPLLEVLKEQLEPMVQDWNQDGKTVVQVEQFVLSVYVEPSDSDPYEDPEMAGGDVSGVAAENPYEQMASTTRFSVAAQNGDLALLLVSPYHAENNLDVRSMLSDAEGTQLGEDDSPEDILPRFTDFPGFAGMDLSFDWLGEDVQMDGHEILDTYLVSILPEPDENSRKAEDKENTREHSLALLEQLGNA